MAKFPLVGPTYTAQSPKFACERAMNLYCETAETPSGGKGGSRMMLVKIPGLQAIHNLPDKPLRCLYSGDGIRVFAVSGSTLYELFQDTSFTALGNVQFATSPAQIFSNGLELFVVSGPKGYIADGATVEEVVDCCMGEVLREYFIALDGTFPGESKTFRISGLLDGKSWDPLDFENVAQSPDNIQSMIVDHGQLQFQKQQTSVGYYFSGDLDFPISEDRTSFVEQGSIAPWSVKKIDNTMIWLGGDERGAGVVWRMVGNSPTRVSDYAIETAIQNYTQAGLAINDAVGMSEQYLGHTFYHLSFPTANATWTYDCSTGLWHERGTWNPATATWSCHKARYHCYAWGKHLVGGGDPTSGIVYEQSIAFQDDNGALLRWLRVSPHLANGNSNMTGFSNLFIDFQVGVGVDSLVDVNGLPRQPVALVRHSNDGGHNWNPEIQLELGKVGQYSYRARQIMCGSGRDRVVEVSGTDPVQIAMVGADMDADVGPS